MEIYKFSFDTNAARELREAINDRVKYSIEREADKDTEIKGPYRVWYRLCATMDRLEDTLAHINRLELGKLSNGQAAFDFYEFINCSYVVIECIKTVVQAFGIDKSIIEKIEKSQEIFGTKYSVTGNDGRFFEYVRALCSVHPLCTSRQKEYLNGSKFHCCRFVAWTDRGFIRSSRYDNADLIALVYATNSTAPIHIGLYVKEFESYLKKWIDSIPSVIEAKNNYVDEKFANLSTEPMKTLDDFGDDIVGYIEYLKAEYIRRIDESNDYILDEFSAIFRIQLSNEGNQAKLEKYKSAILYALGFLHHSLQTMCFEGFDNTGIEYPDRNIETELFLDLASPNIWAGEFSEYSYNLEKVYTLSSTSDYHYFDKQYARDLLGAVKPLINKYVLFANDESDEEVYVLVKLALFLENLTRKSVINRNIPNDIKYREKVLTQEELDELRKEDPIQEATQEELEEFLEMIKKYGG